MSEINISKMYLNIFLFKHVVLFLWQQQWYTRQYATSYVKLFLTFNLILNSPDFLPKYICVKHFFLCLSYCLWSTSDPFPMKKCKSLPTTHLLLHSCFPSRGSLVPLHFLQLEWYHQHIWDCWYSSWQSLLQLVIYPAWHYMWCTLYIS